MEAEYSIVADRRHGLMRVTMAGFFGAEDVQAFVRDLRNGLATLGCAPNQHVMLCDVRGMKIQTQEIVGAFGNVVGAPGLRSRKLAFVTGSSLSRLQTRRLTNRDGVEFFNDIDAASAWLLQDGRQAHAA